MGTIIKEDFSDIALDGVDIVVTFSAPPGRQQSGATGLLTPKGRPVRALDGQLQSPELDSGHCHVLIAAGSWVESFDIVVPESGEHRLRDLLDTFEVPDPPQVSLVKQLRDEVVAAAELVEAGLEGTVHDDDPRLSDERTPTDSSVGTAKITDQAITGAKIADATINGGQKLVDSSVSASKLSNNAATTVKIADKAVTAAKIADGTITGTQVAAGSIQGTKLVAASVTNTQLDAPTKASLVKADASQSAAQVQAIANAAAAALVNGSPAALDTLQELAAALGNDQNFATTVTNQLAEKVATTDTRLSDARPPTDHSTDKLTSGTLPVARGGIGRGDLVDGSYMRGSGAAAVQMRTPAQVLADIGGAVSSPVKNPKLSKWAGALARRATRPARLLDISDSMDEMTTDGWGSVWPHQLMGAAKRFFIPAHTTWNQNEVVTGEALFNLGVPSGSAFGVAPATAIAGVPRLWPIRDEASNGAMTISIAGYSKVSVLWVDAAGASLYVPNYSVDGAAAAALPSGTVYNGSVKKSDLPVTGSTLSITRGPGGKWMVYGLIVEQGSGAIPIEVMNLSRSGSKPWDWNVWLAATIGAESGSTALPTGFDPDLIHIGLLGGANDFYGGTPIAGHLSAMEGLVASLQTRCPNADFVFSTQPPLPSNSAWQTYQAQSVTWAQSKGYVLLDWSSLPVPGANPFYMADQTHPRRALSTLCRDLAAPALLPAWSDTPAGIIGQVVTSWTGANENGVIYMMAE